MNAHVAKLKVEGRKAYAEIEIDEYLFIVRITNGYGNVQANWKDWMESHRGCREPYQDRVAILPALYFENFVLGCRLEYTFSLGSWVDRKDADKVMAGIAIMNNVVAQLERKIQLIVDSFGLMKGEK